MRDCSVNYPDATDKEYFFLTVPFPKSYLTINGQWIPRSFMLKAKRSNSILAVKVIVVFVLHVVHVCLVITYSLCSDSTMGNEGSSIPSESTTPNSEWQSVHSSMTSGGQSKRRSSVSSTRLPTPTEPPEPDLTNLTEEEILQIRSVIDMAKDMQHQEVKRIR